MTMQTDVSKPDRFEEVDSFVLCDLTGLGSPVCYASKGFQELYGYSMSECVGQTCVDLQSGAWTTVQGQSALAKVALSLGLSGAVATRSVQLLSTRLRRLASQATTDVMNEPLLSIACRKSGELFVAAVRVLQNTHPSLGWTYKVSLQQDVTKEVSVAAVLLAATKGEEELAFLQSQQPVSTSCVKGPLSPRSLEYLHELAGVMWRESFANKAIDMNQRKKPRLRDDTPEGGRSLASVSTACSMSQVTAKSRKCTKTGHAPIGVHHLGALVAPLGDEAPAAEVDARFIDLLETPAGLDSGYSACDEACMLNELVEKQETRNSTPDSTRPEVGRQELLEFPFPFVIADPTWPQCPIVLVSQGFSKFSARSANEVLGTALASLGGGGGLGPEVSLAVEHLLQAAHEGKFLPEGLSCVEGADRVSAGEVLFCVTGGMVILKQVLLDDSMFVIGVMDQDEDDMDLLPRLSVWLDVAVTTLAAEFFYSAPLRRQVAEGIDGTDSAEF